MTAQTISFRVDERTMNELAALAEGRPLSDALREMIHAQYIAKLYAQAAADAERLRNDPEDLAVVANVREDLDQLRTWS
jgi:hypothetical protein